MASGELKQSLAANKVLDSKLYCYTVSLRDVEYKCKMYSMKYEALSKSSTIIMQKIMAVTMKLRHSQMTNSEIAEENSKV